MEIIKLRTLTKLSRLPDNTTYSGQPVSTIMQVSPKALIHIYYKFQNISFTDEVLNELGITTEYRINKPGISKELYSEFYNKTLRMERGIELIKHAMHNKAIKKRNRVAHEIGLLYSNSKGALQRKNQGH